jgi:hypothetical protein
MDATWRTAASATLHCLTGCAIGEVLGMVIGTALGWHGAAVVALAIALAFVFGYALSMRPLLRSGLSLKAALKIALAADTLSIVTMEIVDNLIMVAMPGAMDAGLGSLLFWATLVFALSAAFMIALPVNWYLLRKGMGHALAHKYHGHNSHQRHGDAIEAEVVERHDHHS